VKVEVRIRDDGSVELVTALSGSPLLIPTSIESAKHSLFICGGCDQAKNSYAVTYVFVLIPGDPCSVGVEGQKQAISQSDDQVTVTRTHCGHLRPASRKPIYLWKCGRIRFE